MEVALGCDATFALSTDRLLWPEHCWQRIALCAHVVSLAHELGGQAQRAAGMSCAIAPSPRSSGLRLVLHPLCWTCSRYCKYDCTVWQCVSQSLCQRGCCNACSPDHVKRPHAARPPGQCMDPWIYGLPDLCDIRVIQTLRVLLVSSKSQHYCARSNGLLEGVGERRGAPVSGTATRVTELLLLI